MNNNNSLSHTTWDCKYHIVFAPKYRREVAYGKLREDIRNIITMLCKRKGVNIIEKLLVQWLLLCMSHLR